MSVKGLIASLGIKAKVRPNKYKKARYAIGNVSKRDLLKLIREFEKLPYIRVMRGGGQNMILLTVNFT